MFTEDLFFNHAPPTFYIMTVIDIGSRGVLFSLQNITASYSAHSSYWYQATFVVFLFFHQLRWYIVTGSKGNFMQKTSCKLNYHLVIM